MENISYRGQNRIVMVASVLEGHSEKYYTEVDIVYLSDNSCLDQFTNDITERLGKSLLVKYKGNKTLVAKKMGISRTTLWRILKREN